jgi:hypothetical protein
LKLSLSSRKPTSMAHAPPHVQKNPRIIPPLILAVFRGRGAEAKVGRPLFFPFRFPNGFRPQHPSSSDWFEKSETSDLHCSRLGELMRPAPLPISREPVAEHPPLKGPFGLLLP